MTFLRTLAYERVKMSGGSGVGVVALAPMFAGLFAGLAVLAAPALLNAFPEGQLQSFGRLGMAMWGTFLLPVETVLLGVLIMSIEHREGHWPRLLLLPVPRGHWVGAKALWVSVGLLISSSLAVVGIGIAALFVVPAEGLDRWGAIAWSWELAAIRGWVSVQGALGVSIFLGLRARTFVVPLGIGALATVFAAMSPASLRLWNPWGLPSLGTEPGQFGPAAMVSVLVLLMGLAGATWFLRNREEG